MSYRGSRRKGNPWKHTATQCGCFCKLYEGRCIVGFILGAPDVWKFPREPCTGWGIYFTRQAYLGLGRTSVAPRVLLPMIPTCGPSAKPCHPNTIAYPKAPCSLIYGIYMGLCGATMSCLWDTIQLCTKSPDRQSTQLLNGLVRVLSQFHFGLSLHSSVCTTLQQSGSSASQGISATLSRGID